MLDGLSSLLNLGGNALGGLLGSQFTNTPHNQGGIGFGLGPFESSLPNLPTGGGGMGDLMSLLKLLGGLGGGGSQAAAAASRPQVVPRRPLFLPKIGRG